MRKELNNIETIEKYLRNELSAADKKIFEEQLKIDTQLQKDVEIQREVVKGIERIGAKQSIKKSHKKYKLGKTGFNLGLGSLIVLSVAAVFMWYTNTTSNMNANQLPEFNELGTTEWADADRYLESQKFTINTANDTVIETEEGIVMYIPKGSFLDENGHEITDEVEFEVKEAMNTEQILRAGLSTKSGDRQLETGGMFYINARKDGKSLKINPEKGIYTEVPTNEVKADMQLFEGKRLTDGRIDWVNPAPLEKFLTPVDILSLNFYPPKYEAKLTELGIDASNRNRAYKDSLYFSFACMRTIPTEEPIIIEEVIEDSVTSVIMSEPRGNGETSNLQFGVKSLYLYAQEEIDTTVLLDDLASCQGIDPAKIQAIWNTDFSNTLIATREFEERLKVIFTTCNNDLLDLYVNNINLNLYELDEKAAQLTSGEQQKAFLKFAARKEGKVKIDGQRVEKLKKHYEEKQRIYAEAVAKTEEAFRAKNRKDDQDAQAKRNEQTTTDIKRKQDNFVEEFNINLTEAYRQLGKPKPKRLDSEGIYRLTLKTGGWKNVDVYVMESTVNRETLDYTDSKTGKKAVIKYESISVSIKDVEQYDRVLVYFIPDQLNSFMRMKKEGAVYTEKLNELMKNDVVCLAYKGEQAYIKIKTNVKPKSYENLKLDKISHEELKQKMRRFDEKQTSSLFKEFDYQLFEQEEKTRINNLKIREEFRAKIEEVIFPCGEEVEEDLLIGNWVFFGKTSSLSDSSFYGTEENITYVFSASLDYQFISDLSKQCWAMGKWKRKGDTILIEEGEVSDCYLQREDFTMKYEIALLTKETLVLYNASKKIDERYSWYSRTEGGAE